MENTEILAKIVKLEDGYHVEDSNGTSKVCNLADEGKTIALPKNDANRFWFNVKKAEDEIAANGFVALYYKESKKFGDRPSTIPNAKLIAYLSDEEQAEYKAIIDRAIEAKLASKAKPMTDLEKAKARFEKAKLAMEKLQNAEQE